MNWQDSHDVWEAKIIASLTGDLDTEENIQVRRHIQSCAACASELREYEILFSHLQIIQRDISVPTLSPALAALKQEIVQQKKQETAIAVAEAENEVWSALYPQLCAHAQRLVHQLNVPNWQGQEEDVVWDIVQESMRRAFEHTQKAQTGEREPIRSLPTYLKRVAQNYGRDLRRSEWRLAHVPTTQLLGEVERIPAESIPEKATENAYREQLFLALAQEIDGFPAKQRQALLTDLAEKTKVEEEPSALQKAFLAVGVRLEEYQRVGLEDKTARRRYTDLVYLAYKRLKNLNLVKEYIAAVQ